MAFDALSDLDRYCRSTLRRSSRHFERFGPLLDHASKTVADPTIWERPWTPPELDLGEAHPTRSSSTASPTSSGGPGPTCTG